MAISETAESTQRVVLTPLAAPIKLKTIPARNPLYDNLAGKKIPSLDGLRAVAVLLVIFHHIGIHYAPHGRGVLTFFVLSGFLITWLLLKEADRNGGISIKAFYVRRVLRIFPAFYAFWAIHLAVTLLTHGERSSTPVGDYVSAFFYVSNYWHAISQSTFHYLGHTWALAIEEQFYLLWPLLLAPFVADLRKLTRVLVAIIVCGDLYRMVLFFKFHASDDWLTFTFDSRIDHLLVGCLLAVLLKRGALNDFWDLVTSRVWISVATFGLIILSIALNFRYGPAYKYAVGFVVDPLLTAIFLVQVIALPRTWAWGWLNWSATRFLGKISYSVFLFHVFANDLAKHVLLPHRPLIIVTPVAIALAAGMGTLSYYLIEIRFLRLKSRFEGKTNRGYSPIIPAAQASTAIPTTMR